MSIAVDPKLIWKAETPNVVPCGARISAGKSGKVERSLPAKAGYDANPLDDGSLARWQLVRFNISQLTLDAVKPFGLGNKEALRCKNMWTLGLALWMFDRDRQPIVDWLKAKFAKAPELAEANIAALNAGHAYGETVEMGAPFKQHHIAAAPAEPGLYRTVTGAEALALGLVAGCQLADLKMFFGGYPITPASALLHHLSRLKEYGITTFQAEDEIAAICSAIGASYAGQLGRLGELGLEPVDDRLAVAVEHPQRQPQRPHVLAAQRLLVAEAERLHGIERQLRDVEVHYLPARQAAVLQRALRVARLGQVARAELAVVGDDEAAVAQRFGIHFQRRRVHRDQHIGLVAGGIDRGRAEIDLERRDAERRPLGGADLGGKIGEGREIVAGERGRQSELPARQLHAVAAVAGKANNDGFLRWMRGGFVFGDKM